jgi:hypothetical protein
MSRFLIALVCLLALGATPTKGAAWRWSNPLPHGNNVNDFAFATNRGYVQVGDSGQLYTSADSVDWTRHDLGFREQLRAATFFGSRFVATGEAGRVVWSDDLATFVTVSLGTANWLEGVGWSQSVTTPRSTAVTRARTGPSAPCPPPSGRGFAARPSAGRHPDSSSWWARAAPC